MKRRWRPRRRIPRAVIGRGRSWTVVPSARCTAVPRPVRIPPIGRSPGASDHLIRDRRGVPLVRRGGDSAGPQGAAYRALGRYCRTAHGSGLGQWRRVVDRTFAWHNQFRRLRARYDKRADIHEAFLSLGCALISCSRCATGGEGPPERLPTRPTGAVGSSAG